MSCTLTSLFSNFKLDGFHNTAFAGALAALATKFGYALPPSAALPIAAQIVKYGVGKASEYMASRSVPQRKSRKKKQSGGAGGTIATLTAPVAVAKKQRNSVVAGIRSLNNGDVVVTHKEYLGDIAGSTSNFAVTATLNLNPGLTEFKWLSALAKRFESYRFENLRFHFETSAPTSTKGYVLLAVDYDPSDPAPSGKYQAMAFRGSVRGPTWSSLVHNSNREDLAKRKTYFVRGGPIPPSGNIATYDVGQLHICTGGQADASNIGEIWVEYTVRLMTPQLGNVASGDSIYAHYSGTSKNDPAGTLETESGIPATYSAPANVPTFTFTAPWSGLVAVSLVGTTLASSTPGGTGSLTELSEVVNSAGTALMAVYYIDCNTGQTATFTLSSATITASNFYFYQGGTPNP